MARKLVRRAVRNKSCSNQIWHHIPTKASAGLELQTRVDVALQARPRDQLTLPAVLTFSKTDCGLMIVRPTAF